MESTNLRKWLQVLDVAKEIEFGYKSHASWEQLVRADTDVFPVVAFLNHFGEEKRRPEIRLCTQGREQQGSLEQYRTWDKSQQQQKSVI